MRVDPDDPHDSNLIEEGKLILVEDEEIKASPEAEAKAEELDIDLNTVSGTGSGGSIKVGDVEDKAEENAAAESPDDDQEGDA